MPPFNRGENHLFPLYVIDGGWMQTARGRHPPIQTIWTGSAATYFGLNQSLEDRHGADKRAGTCDWHFRDRKNKAESDVFQRGIITAVISGLRQSRRSHQKLKFSNFLTRHPPAAAVASCLEKYFCRRAQVCVQCPLEAVLNWSLIGNSRLQNVCFSEHLVVAPSVPTAA